MKILHVSTFDRVNGASIAAYRLLKAQRLAGLDARMWVQKKTISDESVLADQGALAKFRARARPRLDRLPLLFSKGWNNYLYSLSWQPRGRGLSKTIQQFDPDVVHLHWVQGGFLPLTFLAKFTCPIVWTFHDQWPFSGICHYPPEKALEGRLKKWDDWCLAKKKSHYPFDRIHVVAPSEWMRTAAQASELFSNLPVSVLPNPIDTTVFKPLCKKTARASLGLPEELPLLLFAAEAGTRDPRKGFRYLEEACRALASEGLAFGLVAFGHESDAPIIPGVKTFGLGWLKDDSSLVKAYSAVDLLVLPSLMDNLPNTAVEAHACGLPVIGFRTGGIPEIVADEESGFICPPKDAEVLAEGIRRWLAKDFPRESYRKAARERAVKIFSAESRIPDFMDLYRSCLSNNGN